ncbi:helix-turn-helix domain-containing protein [Mycolicibacterium aichiense]|uniref:HTH-type transcriptional regulator n=1 Tax=Mycolicibacterium aichiense TaxID=1799 RepID=A0AAD1HS82_9MYCO|nr:helix-turn-helix transcriptional regulator [Mycolicibacterium aichiense]MCV7018726.1 helix-turn-helix transcriptional regulator [Mycolicibacterium aichiense]BBX10798.1 putative HTH-type transcriptional regulator [Mycolicibacterium aichiense]STZ25544.1 transcriptional regulatory protein [Mycolicibacterium aichiense]
MSREAAGAAIRTLREARDWSLAELAAATGVSIMGLSFLERGVRKPHKGTVQKVENGLGLPPGTYARLVVADDPAAEIAPFLTDGPAQSAPPRTATGIVVNRHSDADVLEAHAEAHLESLNSLIARLPAETSNEYETYIQSVIEQCVKAELLAANSWRVAVNAGAESVDRLMTHLKSLEAIRSGLLARMPGSICARFDQACARSELPEPVIATLIGVDVEQLWDIRNRGAIPPGVLPRVRAFVEERS